MNDLQWLLRQPGSQDCQVIQGEAIDNSKQSQENQVGRQVIKAYQASSACPVFLVCQVCQESQDFQGRLGQMSQVGRTNPVIRVIQDNSDGQVYWESQASPEYQVILDYLDCLGCQASLENQDCPGYQANQVNQIDSHQTTAVSDNHNGNPVIRKHTQQPSSMRKKRERVWQGN
ncbi:hypothetical protein sr17140 [Sporisorium reilianum SRZ2]|uniref:Uncharacterized protein n=1 Tax=Sporisorium reilianum (strain SRZ2) TaxID=999809 RepID=E7A1G5_SPORE|nr:hypothetical protein sr17140 [Sporisorium reilianum SRZ2]